MQSFTKGIACLKNNQSLFFIVPVVFVLLSILAIGVWGLRPGIDLAGGSMLHVGYGAPVTVEMIQGAVAPLTFGEIRVQSSDDDTYILRQRELAVHEKVTLLEALGTLGAVEEIQFNSVGPSIGEEIVRKSWWAISLVSLALVIYIGFAFSGVSKPVASWKYGVVAVLTLIHDVLIPTGLFAYLGHTRGAEVGVLFIVAILATLGVSINDTIVVFDRIRENLKLNIEKHRGQTFKDIVWTSVRQTLARSLNTTITVLIMLVVLYMLGPETTRDFALVLIVGMIAGTYSSILLASPMLVLIEKYQPKQATD